MRFRQLLIQNIFWRGLYFFSVFLLNILISRYFKAEGSGWIYYVINNLSFLLLVLGLSIESGVTYYVSKKEIADQEIATFCLVWSLVATILSFIVLAFLSPVSYPAFVSKTEFVIGCAFYIPGILCTTYFTALFYAKQNFFLPNAVLLLINSLWILFLFFNGRQSFIQHHFLIIYFSSFFLQGLLFAITYFINHAAEKYFALPSIAELKKIFRYSLLALVTNVVFFLVYRIDYWFVEKFCTQHDMGNYIQVSKLVQMFLILPTILASVIFPVIAEGQNKEITKGIQILSGILFLAFLLICGGLVITGWWLFLFVFGDSFDNMYIPYLLLIPGILALSILALLGSFFAGSNKIKVNLIGSILALIIIITGDIIFIPRYGIKAAALVSSIAYVLNLIFVMYVYCMKYHARAIDFFIIPWNLKKIKSLYTDYLPGILRRPITRK